MKKPSRRGKPAMSSILGNPFMGMVVLFVVAVAAAFVFDALALTAAPGGEFKAPKSTATSSFESFTASQADALSNFALVAGASPALSKEIKTGYKKLELTLKDNKDRGVPVLTVKKGENRYENLKPGIYALSFDVSGCSESEYLTINKIEFSNTGTESGVAAFFTAPNELLFTARDKLVFQTYNIPPGETITTTTASIGSPKYRKVFRNIGKGFVSIVVGLTTLLGGGCSAKPVVPCGVAQDFGDARPILGDPDFRFSSVTCNRGTCTDATKKCKITDNDGDGIGDGCGC